MFETALNSTPAETTHTLLPTELSQSDALLDTNDKTLISFCYSAFRGVFPNSFKIKRRSSLPWKKVFEMNKKINKKISNRESSTSFSVAKGFISDINFQTAGFHVFPWCVIKRVYFGLLRANIWCKIR